MQIDSQIETLLEEFKEQRDQIKNMILEVEELRQQIKLLFPEKIDLRTRKFLEDKVKTMVSFYNVLLDMRKEVSASVRIELEARRKLEGDDFDPDDISEILDIRDISRKIEKFKDEKVITQQKRIVKQKGIEELAEKGIDVPGLKELKELEELEEGE